MKKVIIPILSIALFSSCVSNKKFKAQVSQFEKLKAEFDTTSINLKNCNDVNAKLDLQNKTLTDELSFLKQNSSTMLKQLSDMSVLSSSQSESIRKSLENINQKDIYIKDLQSSIQRKDSLNLALVLNLKGALQDVNDDDVNIKVENSAVFISISDKMLFKSGSYEITTRAKEVLGKVAAVIKAQPDVQFMVEGHTDNKAISTPTIRDNWDLSVLRAASVVRVLQNSYGVDPARMIAAGRSEFVSVESNSTIDGRSKNRRTRIVILPQLDQFFKLMETK